MSTLTLDYDPTDVPISDTWYVIMSTAFPEAPDFWEHYSDKITTTFELAKVVEKTRELAGVYRVMIKNPNFKVLINLLDEELILKTGRTGEVFIEVYDQRRED